MAMNGTAPLNGKVVGGVVQSADFWSHPMPRVLHPIRALLLAVTLLQGVAVTANEAAPPPAAASAAVPPDSVRGQFRALQSAIAFPLAFCELKGRGGLQAYATERRPNGAEMDKCAAAGEQYGRPIFQKLHARLSGNKALQAGLAQYWASARESLGRLMPRWGKETEDAYRQRLAADREQLKATAQRLEVQMRSM